MDSKEALVVFEGTKIRRLWHDNELFYSVSDIIAILTDSKDELAYWRKLKQREPQLVTLCHGLKLPAVDGKLRYANCVNTKNAFRLIQSIPSPKAEPFKQWLAKVGYERIQEIENPELAQDSVKFLPQNSYEFVSSSLFKFSRCFVLRSLRLINFTNLIKRGIAL